MIDRVGERRQEAPVRQISRPATPDPRHLKVIVRLIGGGLQEAVPKVSRRTRLVSTVGCANTNSVFGGDRD